MNARSSVCDIFDLPDKILVKIMSNLSVKERLVLASLCKKLNNLVFTEKDLLRNLDFSGESFTSVSEIRKYFENKNTYKHIQHVCVDNFDPKEPDHVLLHYIRRATNLVGIDVIGIKFKDLRELGNFLRPLQHVRYLSINWPNTKSENNQLSLETLRQPFSKLQFFTVHLDASGYSKTFISILQVCQELISLEIFGNSDSIVNQITASSPWSIEPRKLRELSLVSFYGPCVPEVRKHIITVLPNPENWNDWIDPPVISQSYQDEFHLVEKTFEEVMLRKYIEKIPYLDPWVYLKWTRILPLACLMKKVLELHSVEELNEFCCLSGIRDQEICVLKIEDAELLLKNDEHEITYLTLNHEIEQECDVHLLALAFPGLTELVLTNITKSIGPKKSSARKNLRKKLEANKVSSSFTKLVQNTPEIKTLTIHARQLEKDRAKRTWDLSALYQITDWKCLTTLYLSCIPIKSGNFLIEIGKKCKYLENLTLSHLGRSGACCYSEELPKMLRCCHNLRAFSIHQDNMGQVSAIFNSIVNSPNLESVHVISSGKRNSATDLEDSINQLDRRCSKLIDFKCEINGLIYEVSPSLTSDSLSDFEDLFAAWDMAAYCDDMDYSDYSHYSSLTLANFLESYP